MTAEVSESSHRSASLLPPFMNRAFFAMAGWSADAMGSPVAFVIATASCIAWALSGPIFNYSDTWQLVINTATTVLTFLAVFLIQNTQNREGRAVQLKLDELIRTTEAARNRLIDLEHCSDEEVMELQKEFARRRLDPDGARTAEVTAARAEA
jgi:low affinity Fe/Cu permease